MPLVDPLPENANPDLVDLIRFFRRPLGTVPNSVLTMQRRPKIAHAFTELNKAVMENNGRVTAEQKRLIDAVRSRSTPPGWSKVRLNPEALLAAEDSRSHHYQCAWFALLRADFLSRSSRRNWPGMPRPPAEQLDDAIYKLTLT